MKRSKQASASANDPSPRLMALEMEVLHQRRCFAQKLRKRRESLGISQAELARMVGSKQPAIARMESDKKGSVSMDFLLKVALALGIQVPVFLPKKVSQSWRGTRGEIADATRTAGLKKEAFAEVDLAHWESIETKIREKFFSGREGLFWELLKDSREKDSIRFLDYDGHKYLESFLDPEEQVWFLIREWRDQETKVWIYKAKVDAIAVILDKVVHREWYCVSRKIDWLLCGNEHGVLIGVGRPIVSQMKKFEKATSDEVIWKHE